jgi:hypothetical protein
VDYRYLLRRALQVGWQYKGLWLFGLIASLSLRIPLSGLEGLPPSLRGWVAARIPTATTLLPTALYLLESLLNLALLALNSLGHAALVNQVSHAENGGLPSLRAGWHAGRQRAKPTFLILLLLNLPVLVITALGVLPAQLLPRLLERALGPVPYPAGIILSTSVTMLCLLPALALALLLTVPLRVLARLAVRACVLEGHTVRRSLARAWELARWNLGTIALLWLILAAVTAGIVLTVSLPLGLLALVFVPLISLSRATSWGWIALDGVAVLFWLGGMLITATVETFFSAVWTLGYRQWAGLGRTGDEPWPTGLPGA